MTVCPKYFNAYREEELRRHGIESVEVNMVYLVNNSINIFQEYRKGNFKGNSSWNEREIFENVTFSIGEMIENITIRFPMESSNKKGERGKRDVKPEDIEFRVIRYLYRGKCFEISLKQFGEPLEDITFNLKKSSNIYVSSVGQFHDRDSFSKIEVKLGNCLWIDLTYEVINRTLEGACRRWKICMS